MTNAHLFVLATQYLHVSVNWLSRSNLRGLRLITVLQVSMCEQKDCNHIKHNDIMPFPIGVLLYTLNTCKKAYFYKLKNVLWAPVGHTLPSQRHMLAHSWTIWYFSSKWTLFLQLIFAADFHCTPADVLMCFYHVDMWL